MRDNGNEYTPQERSTLALWLLLQRPMTTREMADWLGLTIKATRELLHRIGRVVPAYQGEREEGYRWYICGKTDEKLTKK